MTKIIDLFSGNAFNPAQLVADGYSGVMFKGGQGQLADVPRLRPTWRGLAEAAGLKVGFFWVVDSRYSPESQKAAIKTTFPTADFGPLGLWMDVEKPRIDMTDEIYHQTPYAGYGTVESVARGVLAYSSVQPGTYTGPGAWKLIFTEYNAPADVLEWFAQAPLWTAQYPWIYVPGVSKPSMYGKWADWTFWQYREGPDVDLFHGTQAEFDAAYGGAVVTPPATVPEVFVIERSLNDYDLCITPGSGELPLLNAVEAAQQNGWEAAMNGGAGFDYTDATHAIPKTTGFGSVDGIPFARHLVEGVINPYLDTTYLAPWSILAFRDTRVALIVTKGLEISSGMTQMGAAEWCKAQGYVDAYLMDSGRSAQIEQGGTMLYFPYGPAEEVPQHIGLRKKQTGGGSMKGVAVGTSNIKSTAGVLLHAMTVGEYVYGEWSLTKSDLIGFDHYYTAAHVRMPLGALCKVSVGNLRVTSEIEPGVTPPPPPATVPHMHQTLTDADGAVWTFDCDGVKA